MKIPTKFEAALLSISGLTAGTALAEVISLPDITRPAGGNVIETVDLENNIVNQTVYLAGTVTWLPDASGGNVTVRYNIDRTTDPLLRARVGFGSNSGNLIQQKTANGIQDPDGDGPATNIVNPTDTIDTTPGATTSYTFVMKVIQTAPSPGGDWWYADTVTPGAQDDACFFFWFNPDLAASEASQPTPFAGWRSGNNNYKSVSFLTNGNTGQINFTDFKIYTDGDSPFDTVIAPDTPLAITDLDYNSTTNEVSLSWASIPGRNYLIRYSTDLQDWSNSLLSSEPVVGADEASVTTQTFDLSESDLSEDKLFFRVEEVVEP